MMLARVKPEYTAGPVMAFSGREYVRSEWREVPAGFEAQAKNHPLLDVQPSLEEVRAGSTEKPGLGKAEAVTPVTPPVEEPPSEPEPVPADEPEEVKPEEVKSRPRRSRRSAED